MFAPIESSHEQGPDSVDDPLTRALYAYWLECADGHLAPKWKDIDFMALPGPMLPYLTVIDLTAEGDFVYRYWGRGHTDYHGVDYTNKSLKTMRPLWVRDFLTHQYMRVVESKKPLLFDTRYEKVDQPNYSLRLPLSDDGDVLTGILGLAIRRDVAGPLRHWIEFQQSPRSA